MRDPGSPRSALENDDSMNQRDSGSVIAQITRTLVLCAAFVVLAISIYYAIHVFGRVGQLITNPENARESVDAIGEIIDAPKLTFSVAGSEPVAPGKLAAFLLLLFCYWMWFWIPITMFHAAARIILRSLPERGNRRE